MTRRNAIAVSVTFHAILLTALALYLTIWDRSPEQQDTVVVDRGPFLTVETWREEEPLEEEEPPPVRDNVAENIPTDIEPLPFPPNDSKDFSGPIIEEALLNPPPETPAVTVKVPPVFPADCLREGVSGEVEAVLQINADGRVVGVEITRATKPCFAREATKAFKKWRYAKQMVREVSTSAELRSVTVQVVFNIEDVKKRR